jgi:flavin reductase (DIM6/NTAB) family NADH-FMN oxidoreductase RutF
MDVRADLTLQAPHLNGSEPAETDGMDGKSSTPAGAPEALFREAMSRTAAGVVVVTTDGRGGRSGATVSSFSSMSLTPPSVLVCLDSVSRTLAAIRENGCFCANVLAQEQSALAEIFARRTDHAEDKFALGAWARLTTGAPALEGAVAQFDCRLAKTFSYASHVIVIGEVLRLATRPLPPLVYSGRVFHRLDVL